MPMSTAVSSLSEERTSCCLVKSYAAQPWPTLRPPAYHPQQDLDRDDYVPPSFQQATVDQVFELHKQEQAQKKKQEKIRHKKLAAYGFEGEHSGEAIL